jgi:hypothetical protein
MCGQGRSLTPSNASGGLAGLGVALLLVVPIGVWLRPRRNRAGS